jgi:hypothetical protein
MPCEESGSTQLVMHRPNAVLIVEFHCIYDPLLHISGWGREIATIAVSTGKSHAGCIGDVHAHVAAALKTRTLATQFRNDGVAPIKRE